MDSDPQHPEWQQLSRQMRETLGRGSLSLDEAEKLYREAAEEVLEEPVVKALVAEVAKRRTEPLTYTVIGQIAQGNEALTFTLQLAAGHLEFSVVQQWQPTVVDVEAGDFTVRVDSYSVDTDHNGQIDCSAKGINDDQSKSHTWQEHATAEWTQCYDSDAPMQVGVFLDQDPTDRADASARKNRHD